MPFPEKELEEGLPELSEVQLHMVAGKWSHPGSALLYNGGSSSTTSKAED